MGASTSKPGPSRPSVGKVLDFEGPVADRVMRWTEKDLRLMRTSIRHMEEVLETARAELRVAERHIRTGTS